MPLPDPTVDDLVTTLHLSNKTNIIVEGKDDAIIYKELVTRLGMFKIDFHPAGGRETLLNLYDKLSLYESKDDFRHVPVVFIADRDMWVFRGIPTRYKEIIWTDGYSIENDLYSSANLRERVRDSDYEQVLTSISAWFACKVVEYLEKNPGVPKSVRDEKSVSIDFHCDRIIPKGETTLAPGLESLPSDHERVQKIKNEYSRLLRGKLLFQMLVRFLNNPKHGFSKATVNDYALYNEAITAAGSNELFSQLEKEVKKKLDKQKGKIKYMD